MSKFFWHVTPTIFVNYIMKTGIFPSEDGNLGEGVYCVKAGDFVSLESVLSLETFEDNGYSQEELSIIEFYFSGSYEAFQPAGLMEGFWIFLPHACISATNILRHFEYKK